MLIVKTAFISQKPMYKKTARRRFKIRWAGSLHVGVKLLLAVLLAVTFALKGADTLEALAWLAHMDIALAHFLDNARFLHLLLESLLQAIVALFAVFVGMNCHRVRGS